MARRPEPNRKKPLDVLDDVLAGHREAALAGPSQAAKYLERALLANRSMPNACKFFVYDLLAEASAAAGDPGRCGEAVALAQNHLEDARVGAPRHLQAYLPQIRLFERGIGQAVAEGHLSVALALCEAALALGLGSFYAAKADSIRRLL